MNSANQMQTKWQRCTSMREQHAENDELAREQHPHENGDVCPRLFRRKSKRISARRQENRTCTTRMRNAHSGSRKKPSPQNRYPKLHNPVGDTSESREMSRRAQMQRPHAVGNKQDAPLGTVYPHQYLTEHGNDQQCLPT
jgi:hypothetical protein